MRDLNQVILMGRLGADPILRQTKSGSSVVNFSVATARRFPRQKTEARSDAESSTQANTEYLEETEWHKVVVWGKQALLCYQNLRKGDPVFLVGSIRSHSYADQNGVSRVSYEIHADDVNFLSSARRGATTVDVLTGDLQSHAWSPDQSPVLS